MGKNYYHETVCFNQYIMYIRVFLIFVTEKFNYAVPKFCLMYKLFKSFLRKHRFTPPVPSKVIYNDKISSGPTEMANFFF